MSDSPLRVCYLIDELAPAGTETQLLALIRHLDRSVVQPYLCLLRGDSPLSEALEPSDCPVLRLGVGSLKHPRTLRCALAFARFLRRERIDVVQVYFPDSSYFGVPLARLAGVTTVLRTRNNVGHWLTPLHRLFGRLLNPLTTATIANCEAAREALLLAERPRPDSVLVVENGVDLERFASIPPLDTSRSLFRIGAVANLRPVKGLHVLIEAAAALTPHFPNLIVEVAGEGSDRQRLTTTAEQVGLKDRFVLRGSLRDIPAFLAELDVTVCPSLAEGMSNAVLEYMAARRPVVATTVGANPRLIENEVHGLLIPPNDVGALSRAVRRLLECPHLAVRFAEAGRERVEQEFSRPAMVRRFEQFYRRLARRNRAA